MQRLGDILEADTVSIFDHFRDFTEPLTVGTNSGNVRTIMGSLQSDLVTFNASVSEILNAFSIKLFMPEQVDLSLSEGQILYVNGHSFRVTATSLNYGVRELALHKE